MLWYLGACAALSSPNLQPMAGARPSVEISRDCSQPGDRAAFVLFLTTTAGEGYSPKGYSLFKGRDFPATGSTYSDMPAWKTDLEEATWTVNTTGAVPAPCTNPDPCTAQARAGVVLSGGVVPMEVAWPQPAISPGAPTAVMKTAFPKEGREAALHVLRLTAADRRKRLVRLVREETLTPSHSVTSTDLLPFVDTFTVDASSAARPTLRWTAARPLGEAHAGIVLLEYAQGGKTYHWTLVFPASVSTVTVPALPDSLAAARPANAAVKQAVFLRVAGGSYDTVRAWPADPRGLHPALHAREYPPALKDLWLPAQNGTYDLSTWEPAP